jgi:putative flippase GtrA
MNTRIHSCPSARRWLIFYAVGAMGIVIQMSGLLMLTAWARLGYLVATALSVEIAILHNFFWHERWTWADRIQSFRDPFFRRLSYFHLTNGAISLAGNIILMQLFVERFSLSYVPANAIAVTLCSVANFFASDRIVFRSDRENSEAKLLVFDKRNAQVILGAFLMVAMVPLSGTAALEGAELSAGALKAWQKYVEATERRIETELSSPRGFLVLDFQEDKEAARERQALLLGEIQVKPMWIRNQDGRRFHIPDGTIHHWRGSVFIPAVTLDFVLSRIENPNAGEVRQEDVLDTRILERSQDQL